MYLARVLVLGKATDEELFTGTAEFFASLLTDHVQSHFTQHVRVFSGACWGNEKKRRWTGDKNDSNVEYSMAPALNSLRYNKLLGILPSLYIIDHN